MTKKEYLRMDAGSIKLSSVILNMGFMNSSFALVL